MRQVRTDIHSIAVIAAAVVLGAVAAFGLAYRWHLLEQARLLRQLRFTENRLNMQIGQRDQSLSQLQNDYAALRQKYRTQRLVQHPSDQYLEVYNYNDETYEPEIDFYISASNTLPLRDRLDQVADKLSSIRFGGFSITVRQLVVENRQLIATIETDRHNRPERPSQRHMERQVLSGNNRWTDDL